MRISDWSSDVCSSDLGIEDDDMERGEFADDEMALSDRGAGDNRPPSLCLSSALAASATAMPRMAVAPAALAGQRAPPAHKGRAARLRLSYSLSRSVGHQRACR